MLALYALYIVLGILLTALWRMTCRARLSAQHAYEVRTVEAEMERRQL